MLKQGFSHTHCSVFTFTLRTFAVVLASYLKASVCPFSRYTLNILGTHSRRSPSAPQKCYCVPSHLALPNLEPHQVRDSFLAFGNFLKDTLAMTRNMHGSCSIDWGKARMCWGSEFSFLASRTGVPTLPCIPCPLLCFHEQAHFCLQAPIPF